MQEINFSINKSPNQSALPNTVHPADELAEAKPSAGGSGVRRASNSGEGR
jgi:hypothetical protein